MSVKRYPITFAIRKTRKSGQDGKHDDRFRAVAKMPSGWKTIGLECQTLWEAEEQFVIALVNMRHVEDSHD